MTDPTPERIKEAFQSVAQHDPADQSARLDEVCGGDAVLRSAVESLLAAREGAGSFLEKPLFPDKGKRTPEAADLPPTFTTDSTSTRSAEVIDRYRLLEKLGAGGMGEVWLAEQQKPVRRKVALKVIKAGMDTAQVIARFDAERQALALMDHPAIAKVLDAGATAAGRPYFVMEHVAGLPITQHCDQLRLATRERLELFLQVCEGVQHAHQKAVLHRDLKPSNVLVSSQDGRATPKIIDFGIAKAMAQPLTEITLNTGIGMLLGTPGYMSPEQADPAGDVDTSTDVYSLGIILYELLVGVLPFDRHKLEQAGWETLGRVLREETPSAPSTRLTTLPPEARSEAASLRQTEERALRRQLSGDLDWITLKAIEPVRTRRYGSPLELADEIRRHLRDEPVRAGPPSTAYRIGKFVRRHRVGVAAASVLMLAVATALIGTSFGLVQARRAEAAAKEQAASSGRVSEFLGDLLRSVDPERLGQRFLADLRDRVGRTEHGRGGSESQVAARQASFDGAIQGINRVDAGRRLVDEEILARAGKTIDQLKVSEPVLAARLQATMGSAYNDLGLPVRAESFLKEALDIQRRVLGEEHPETLRTMDRLGEALNAQGRKQEAQALLRETLGVRRRVLGEDHADTALSVRRLGDAFFDFTRENKESEALYREALEMQRRLIGTEHKETLLSMNNLANTYITHGRYLEAERLYREVLDIQRRLFGEEDRFTLAVMGNLGATYFYLGRPAESERFYKQALAGFRRLLGDDHSMTLRGMGSLAQLYLEQRRYQESETLYEEAVGTMRRVLGDEHPQTLNFMPSLAEVYMGERRYDEAIQVFTELIGIKRRLYSPEDPRTLITLRNLGRAHLAAGHESVARDLLRTVLEARNRAAEASGATAEIKRLYASELLTCEPADMRDPQVALRFAKDAATQSRYEDPKVLETLALAYDANGSPEEAARVETRALEVLPEGASPMRRRLEGRLAEHDRRKTR